MNLQIFAYTDYPEFQALLEVECRDMTGIRPVIHSCLDELKGMIDLFQSLDVLVIDEPEDEKAREDLRRFLDNSLNRIKKVYILGEKLVVENKVRNYARMDIATLFEDLKSFVNPNNKQHMGWTAVPLSTLVHFDNLPFDLYLKISHERFIKRIPAFEGIERSLIEDFQKRGVTELYCDKKNNRDFSMMLINNMINKVEKSYECVEQKLVASSEVFQTTREIVQHLGLSSRVIEVCESTIERISQDIMETRDQFGNYIRNLKDSPALAFQYKLIELTSFICGQLIYDMNYFAKDEQIKKLVFASFFCDMTLKNPDFLHLRKSDQLEKLPLEEHNQVSLHALRASELVSTYKNTTKEVSLIVRQHHGSFSGIGFPVQKSTELLPLSKVFMISQDLSYDILTDGENSAVEILKNFVRRHQRSGLQDLLTTLEGMMEKNLKESA